MKCFSGIQTNVDLLSLAKQALSNPQKECFRKDSCERTLVQEAIDKASTDSSTTIMTIEEARCILSKYLDSPHDDTFPICAVNAILLLNPKLVDQMEKAISKSKLRFTGSTSEIVENKKWENRMERLRLKLEESKYTKLTSNLDTAVADDINVRSMTYASSVGLNMIVAPISFGVFMFFFSGHVFGWGLEAELRPGHVDSRKVITAVVSGVIMLFIEMILFVIRSHEFDASITKKKKSNDLNPFGYSKKRAMRTFTG